MTNQQFIQTIAPYMQKYAKQYGFQICSAAIAQACLESGYGTSTKAQHNNFFGMKYRPSRVTCNSGTFVDGGSEQKADGSYVPITDQWYNFASVEAGCEGYYQFINIPLYAAVKTATTPLTYLQAIKAAGYATSNDYVQNVFKVVQKWNLTQYDAGMGTTSGSSSTTKALDIVDRRGSANITAKKNRQIQWIVLHYTAGTRSTGGAARNTAAFFSRPSTKASADYIVDDDEIVQYNPDPANFYCWAVGGNKYLSLSTSLGAKYYGQCTNANSISIEMCSRKTNTSTLNASDDDWYLTDATINNAVQLTRYLMQLYNIDINHVIMHHMVNGKWCPQPWTKREATLEGWYNFLNKVKAGAGTASKATSNASEVTPAAAYLVKINTDILNIRKGPGTTYPIVGQVKRGSVYTIVSESSGWGQLKSGAGYIKLSYTVKV